MSIKLKAANLKSGEVIEFSDGLTVIVGPNNAGKSLILTELWQELQTRLDQQQSQHIRAVGSAKLDFQGPANEFIDWLGATYFRRPPGQYPDGNFPQPNYPSPAGTVHEGEIREHWGHGRLGPLAGLLIRLLGADGRTQMVSGVGALNLLTERPSSPLQFLYADRELEQQASELMMRAFHLPLTINRYAGSTILAHVGRTKLAESMPPSKEYLAQLMALPQLQEQGDGIRAFMGILLTITTAHYPIVLIDEPEAFLHPPQAYLLGRVLAEQHNRGIQIVMATHSSDILRGVTSAKASSGNVTVVRLTRSDAGNHVAQVPAASVGDLYEDPLIKYYGILDGLFYHGVVLCEADSDCTYYRAVLDSVKVLDDGTTTESISLHFAQCGGKARLAKAVKALRAAQVPVACVVDFDSLQNDSEFTDLVSACGGDPTVLAPRRNDIVSAIQAKAVPVDRLVARTKIDQALDGRNTAHLSSGEVSKIKEAVSARSGWKEAKQQGRGCLSGQAVTSFDTLNTELRKLGIFLVDKGELERFHPEVPADNKAEWLRQVLEHKKYAEATDAATFVKDIASAILDQQ
jgi:hypothetical protein